jgi:hypothetical protein
VPEACRESRGRESESVAATQVAETSWLRATKSASKRVPAIAALRGPGSACGSEPQTSGQGQLFADSPSRAQEELVAQSHKLGFNRRCSDSAIVRCERISGKDPQSSAPPPTNDAPRASSRDAEKAATRRARAIVDAARPPRRRPAAARARPSPAARRARACRLPRRGVQERSARRPTTLRRPAHALRG